MYNSELALPLGEKGGKAFLLKCSPSAVNNYQE